MPYLKAKNISEVRQKIEKAMSRIRPATTGREKDCIPTTFINLWNGGNIQRLKGALYESYIGFLYENKGYKVEYNGIIKNGADGGIDLICRDGNCTILVQCKNYANAQNFSSKSIVNYYNACKDYKKDHETEQVFANFWISVKINVNNSEIQNLLHHGLKIHDGFRIPKNIQIVQRQISTMLNIDAEERN